MIWPKYKNVGKWTKKIFRVKMHSYFKHVRNLEFEEAPDYDFVRNLFVDLSKNLQNSGRFDWKLNLFNNKALKAVINKVTALVKGQYYYNYLS